MTRRKYLVLLAFFVASGSQLFAQEKKLPSGKEVIDRAVKALGGREKFEKIKSSSMTGTIEFQGLPIRGTLQADFVPPRKLAIVAQVQGMEQQQVVSGDVAWEKGFGGTRIVTREEADRFLEGVDMTMIVNANKLFKSIKNEGSAEVDGEKVYHIVMKRSEEDKTPEQVFFSIETGLPKHMLTFRKTPQGKLKIESTVKEYKEFGGIRSAVLTEQKIANLGITQIMKVESINYNKPIDNSKFAVPDEVKEMLKTQNKDAE